MPHGICQTLVEMLLTNIKNHIKNAIFFDIDKISDNKSKLPHASY